MPGQYERKAARAVSNIRPKFKAQFLEKNKKVHLINISIKKENSNSKRLASFLDG